MKNGIASIISCRSVLPQSGAISGSLEARKRTLPYPCAGNDAPDASADPDDQTRLVCLSGQAILSQMKLMNGLSKKIEKKVRSLARCLVAGSTVEGCTSSGWEGMAGSWPDDISETGYATPVEEFSDTFLGPTIESVSQRTVEAGTSTFQEKAASDDPLPRASTSFEAALAQMKTRNSETKASGTAVKSRTTMLPEKEASMSCEAAEAQMKARNLSLRRSLDVERPPTEECVVSNSQIYSHGGSSVDKCSAGGGNDSRKYLRRYPGRYSISGSVSYSKVYSNGGSSLDKCSAGGGNDSPKYLRRYPGRYSISGSVDLQSTTSTDSRRNSSFTICDLPRDESSSGKLDSRRSSTHARHSSFTVSDLPRYESSGGKLDSRRSSTQARHSSFTVSDLPRYESSGGKLDSRRSSTQERRPSFTVPDLPRYESTGGKLDSWRSSTQARHSSSVSALPRYGRSSTPPADSRRSSTHASTTDARRYSTGAREVPVPISSKKSALLSPVYCVRSLLNPATSMETFLSLICTEETLVSTYDSRVQLSAQKSKRSSSEVLLGRGLPTKRVMTSSENLDWPTIRTAPERHDSYSNSNISWSNRLENERSLKVKSPKKEEPRSSTPEPSPPADHLAIYVGSERKKLFISSPVFNHELFKQLLNSHHCKLEKRDGNSAIVLTCDIDYFRRLLFFVDQRPQGIR